MKTCVIMQPTYLPWLGYFDLMQKSDVFVFLDHAQFSKQSWQQRNKIRDKNGELILTIPVKHCHHKESLIKDVLIDKSRNPLKKHFKSLEINYSKSRNYPFIIENLREIYSKDYDTLMELNIDLIQLGCRLKKIIPKIVYSSDLQVVGQKVEALVDICKKVDADHYLSPVGSKEYIEQNNLFRQNNIELNYQNYVHPVYQQINYSDFISHMSFIDYLFNVTI